MGLCKFYTKSLNVSRFQSFKTHLTSDIDFFLCFLERGLFLYFNTLKCVKIDFWLKAICYTNFTLKVMSVCLPKKNIVVKH